MQSREFSLILTLGFFVLLPLKGYTQNPATNDSGTAKKIPTIGLEGHKGFVIIHSESIREVEDAYPYGLTLNINWQNVGKEAWQTCHCYPRAGFGLSYYDFDNQEVLGRGYVLNGYIEPFFRLGERWHLGMKASAGLGYLTNPHDPETNTANRSYSVAINGFLQVNLGAYYRLADHWRIFTNVNYKHISNGGIEKPNKGINYPTAGLGVEYLLKDKDLRKRRKGNKEVPDSLRHEFELNGFLGSKELNNGDNNRHWNYGLQFFYNYQLTPLHVLRFGGEWIINNAVKHQISEDEATENEKLTHHRGNLLAGHAFSLGRFRFSEQLGLYLYRPYGQEDAVYQRYSLTYKLSEDLHTGIGFKSHRHVADFLDFRISIRF